jgi:hypothetical protein
MATGVFVKFHLRPIKLVNNHRGCSGSVYRDAADLADLRKRQDVGNGISIESNLA